MEQDNLKSEFIRLERIVLMEKLEQLKNVEVLLGNAKDWINSFGVLGRQEKVLKRLINEHIDSAQDFTNRLMKEIK